MRAHYQQQHPHQQQQQQHDQQHPQQQQQQQHDQQPFMPQQPLLSGFPVPLTPNYPSQLPRVQSVSTRPVVTTSYNQQSTPLGGGGGGDGGLMVVFPSTDRLSVGNDADDDQSIPSLQSLPSEESPKQAQSEGVHGMLYSAYIEKVPCFVDSTRDREQLPREICSSTTKTLSSKPEITLQSYSVLPHLKHPLLPA